MHPFLLQIYDLFFFFCFTHAPIHKHTHTCARTHRDHRQSLLGPFWIVHVCMLKAFKFAHLEVRLDNYQVDSPSLGRNWLPVIFSLAGSSWDFSYLHWDVNWWCHCSYLAYTTILLRFHGCNYLTYKEDTVSYQISWSSDSYTLSPPHDISGTFSVGLNRYINREWVHHSLLLFTFWSVVYFYNGLCLLPPQSHIYIYNICQESVSCMFSRFHGPVNHRCGDYPDLVSSHEFSPIEQVLTLSRQLLVTPKL